MGHFTGNHLIEIRCKTAGGQVLPHHGLPIGSHQRRGHPAAAKHFQGLSGAGHQGHAILAYTLQHQPAPVIHKALRVDPLAKPAAQRGLGSRQALANHAAPLFLRQAASLQSRRLVHHFRAHALGVKEQAIHIEAYAANHRVLLSRAARALSMPSTAADTMPPA